MTNKPESYFKYRPLWQWEGRTRMPYQFTAAIFQKRQLWYAAPNSLNDPFDCNLRLHAKDSTDAEWEAYCDDMSSKNPSRAAQMKVIKARKLWKSEPTLAERVGQDSHDTNYNKSSLLCLAKRGDSVPMFSYYADSHRGIAMEFRFSDEEIPCGVDFQRTNHRGTPYEGKIVFREVEYSSDFPELNYHRLRGTDQLVRSLLFTKLSDWKHEEEFRIFRRRVAASAVSFDDRLLARVIFGCKAGDDEHDLVREYLKDWSTSVLLTKTMQETNRFGLILEDFESVGG